MDIKTEEKIKLCKLCFQYCDNSFEVFTDETNKMLELLLVRSDPNTEEEQIICTNCSVNIEVSYHFKSSCLNTESYIKSVINSNGDSKVNLNEIFVNRVYNKDTVNLPEGHAVCRLCLKLVQSGCWTPLNEEINDETLMMFKQWLPELDFNITEDPVMCMSCQECLESYFDFIKQCPDVQEKHYGFKEKCDQDQIESKLISPFTLENDLKHEDCDTEFKCQKDGNVNEIKFSNKIQIDTETQDMGIEQAEIIIKSENDNFSRYDEAITLINENATMPKSKNLYNCELCTYSTNARKTLKRHIIVHQDVSTAAMYNCQVCPFTTKYKSSLKVHMKIHSDPSDLTVYQCEACKYKTKYKADLKKHLSVHKYTYSCNMCAYKSNTPYDIDLHALVHGEAVVYSCEACPYKTKHRSTFNRHKVTHLDVYECKVCIFKTRQKNILDKHILTHKHSQYRCGDCDFQTNHKMDFEKHSLLHLPATKTNMFHCAECKFMTKYKRNLRKHMDIHQKGSSMKMYRCDICYFETKHKHYIKRHASTHRDPSERKMYTCDMCDYKALRNRNVLRHKSKKHGVGENK